jgi:hypothetical protein
VGRESFSHKRNVKVGRPVLGDVFRCKKHIFILTKNVRAIFNDKQMTIRAAGTFSPTVDRSHV